MVEPLYAEFPRTDAPGTDDPDNSGADGGSATRRRRTRSDAGSPRQRKGTGPGATGTRRKSVPQNAAPPGGYDYSPAQIDDLAIGLAKFLQMTARGPALMRSQQWGVEAVPDVEHGGTKLQWRGEHWLVSDEEATEFGRAWANVIRWYAPPEAVGKGAAWTTAIGTSLTIAVPRVMTDMEKAQAMKQAARAQAEQALRDAQQPGPFPTDAGVGAESLAGEPQAEAAD